MRKEIENYQVEVPTTILPGEHPFSQDWETIQAAGRAALWEVFNGLENHSQGTIRITTETKSALNPELARLEDAYLRAMLLSGILSERALIGKRHDKTRVPYHNPEMTREKNIIDAVIHQAAKVWILDGLVIGAQRAGLKHLAYVDGYPGIVHDVLGSATSLNLGAHFPWVTVVDHLEDHLGLRDNFCIAYHAAIKHGFLLPSIAGLHPSKREDIRVYAECSGTMANSVAIEASCAYAESIMDQEAGYPQPKILAIDGTWAGGFGSAREATGFGVAKQQEERGGSVWVDRCLPPPTKENKEAFLEAIVQKIQEGGCAGIFLEPTVIGDLGIVEPSEEVLTKMLEILATGLNGKPIPLILDCVQQGSGRTGNYWGLPDVLGLKEYPGLVLTTAKSASNGQAVGFTAMPAEISEAAYPYSHITTNQMNGSLLRALVVAKVVMDPQVEAGIRRKGEIIDRVATEYDIPLGSNGVRGRVMNRGVYVGTNELVEIVQATLLIEDGILVGALPNTIRVQPMLLETDKTIGNLTQTICHRVREVQKGNIHPDVVAAVNASDEDTGLARTSTTK